MNPTQNTILIPAETMRQCFIDILSKTGYATDRSKQLAEVFTQNSVDGIYTHGINRFARFIEHTKMGVIVKDAIPSLVSRSNGIEQWDGNLGPGILNAIASTDQSIRLADQYGIGCVALRNTNHWMGAGTYGWRAALRGYVFIGFTNTIANMPSYRASNAKLGNNPLVLAVPYKDTAIVLDMAMSQYSFGSMELKAMKNEMLEVPGGYDEQGNLTTDPAAILKTRNPLAIGYWKGAGLSLLLDIIATILTGGLATHEISKRSIEYGMSQVFISINSKSLSNYSSIPGLMESIISDYKQSVPRDKHKPVTYPGERALKNRAQNLEKGIPVVQKVWDEIQNINS